MPSTVAQPNPPRSEDAASLALAACARVLRPVIRLALSLGLKSSHLQDLLTELLLDEGKRIWRSQGVDPNISQLSVTTGLNRKAITLRVRTPSSELPRTETSAAAKTLTLWVQMWENDAVLQSLPLSSDSGVLSFEVVARRASRGNLHHRVILEELVRLDLVDVSDGIAVLKTSSFVPRNDLRAMLTVLGDNAHDHLASAVSNVLRTGPPMLERAIYARGLSPQDSDAIQELVRVRWTTLHHELADRLNRAVDSGSDSNTARIRVGIYAYAEAADTDPLQRRIGPAAETPGEQE